MINLSKEICAVSGTGELFNLKKERKQEDLDFCPKERET